MPKVNPKYKHVMQNKEPVKTCFTSDPIWSVWREFKKVCPETRKQYLKTFENTWFQVPGFPELGIFIFRDFYIGSGNSSYFELTYFSMVKRRLITLTIRQNEWDLLPKTTNNNNSDWTNVTDLFPCEFYLPRVDSDGWAFRTDIPTWE